MTTRHCGLKGCVGNVVPGAFLEALALLGPEDNPSWMTVRIEVCADHYALCGDGALDGLTIPEGVTTD